VKLSLCLNTASCRHVGSEGKALCITLSPLEKIPPVSMYLSCFLLHTGNYEGLDSLVRERKLQRATMSFRFPVCYARGRTGTNYSSLK